MEDLVAETVLRIVAAQARVPVAAVRLEATPQDLGLDSLGLVEVVFAIEEAFDITVPFNSNSGGAGSGGSSSGGSSSGGSSSGGANAPGPQAFDISTIGAVVAAVRGLVAAPRQ